MTAPRTPIFLLFFLSLAVLVPGIWEATGLSGKDEFFLGLRTPMEMIEGGHWLVPFLDGVPRIRKPPLLYWLGRADFEILGISLTSARLLGSLFAALLVVATAGIARTLSGKPRSGLVAGCILLGCLGLASEGRRFMLDVPVAALSAAAFWTFLIWLKTWRWAWLTAATVLLAAGFLTKGPIVALVFGGGTLALLLTGYLRLTDLRDRLPAIGSHLLLWAGLALPWFFVVRTLYPEAVDRVLTDELESRQFFNLSPGILLGLLNIALPWVFVFAVAAWRAGRQAGLPRLLLIWFLATFLPFLFIKSFDRYLIGSLVPLAILLALTLPELRQRWPFRLGAGLALLLGGGLAAFALWFGLGGGYWLLLPGIYLGWAWWRERSPGHTLAAPILYWLALLWGVFPALGVNAVPAAVVDLGRQQPVAMYDGPQPALLPILSARTHRHYGELDSADLARLAAGQTPIFLEEHDLPRFQRAVNGAGYQALPLGSYRTLASHGSGLRFARAGATAADWRAALTSRQLDPLLTTVQWFQVKPR